MSAELSPLAQTARLVAAVRALESERADALFSDPFAKHFAGTAGFELFDEAMATMVNVGAGMMITSLAIRTRFFDEAVLAAVHAGIRQIVAIAAGFDTRAFRLPLSPDVCVWELDRPEIFSEKETILDAMEAKPACRRCVVGVDLRDDWKSALMEKGFDVSLPAVFVVEGLLVYLAQESAIDLFRELSDLSATGSRVAFDVMGAALLQLDELRGHRDWMGMRGSPLLFGTDEPESLGASHGWQSHASVLGEPAANFGRWPYPVIPRTIPGIPRSYYVLAERG